MSDFQQQAVRLAAQQQTPEWLSNLRQHSAESWLASAWPTRKTEQWKYTPLLPLQKTGFNSWGVNNTDWQNSIELLTLDATRLVFVNGVFDAASSSELPPEVVRFSEANDEEKSLIQKHLGRVVDGEKHLFAVLSNTWIADGLLVHVPRNQRLAKPIYVVHVSTPGVEPTTANQRLLIVLEQSAQAEVIEHYLSTDAQQNGFVNSLSEIVIGENASLHHYRLNMEEENLLHVGGVHVDLLANARLRGFTLAYGSQLKRIDYQINHRGAGAETDLQGIYLPRHNQMVDYHTNLQHWAPHCTSSEIFRGIMSDSARAVFNGRIHIHPDAQKTLAELSNKNLLTSDKAEVNTKPELEIYADDVKCAHGATVSQLNHTALYYLQSRGISRQEAEVMMSFGFINELLQNVAQPAVQDYLIPRLARLFGRDAALLQRIQHD
jgi:Fe-S cluster assembly protein SufD